MPNPTAGLALAAIVVLPAAITAQKLRWKIPHRGVLLFINEVQAEPVNMHVGDRFVPGFGVRNPAVLLQSELDPTQRFIAQDPANLWELAMHIAFDLRTAKARAKLDHTFGFVTDFGAVQIKGTAGEVAADGMQKIRVEVQRVALPARRYAPRVLEFLNQHNGTPLAGTLTIERRINFEFGRVSSFKSDFQARIGTHTVRLREAWQFAESKPCRYPGFRSKIAGAIAAGAQHVLAEIANVDKAAAAAGIESKGRSVNTGLLALCLLTVVKAGIAADHPTVAKGFADLRGRVILDTYSLATALMAVEALYAPPGERRLLIEGRIKKPLARKITPADKALMKKWADRILANADGSVTDQAYERRFTYTTGAHQYDNSNTQYALLGLYSAHLCGIDYPASVWHSMANHWLADRQPDGKPLRLPLVSHRAYGRQRELARTKKSRTRTVTRGARVAPTGWPYTTLKPKSEPIMPLTHSMTAAGITGLTICEAVLRSRAGWDKAARKSDKAHPAAKAVYRRLRSARDQGFAWLLANFSMRGNKHHHGFGFHFYYLYGVERACELSQVALIGDRDWYFEGSMMLLGMQRAGGKFDMATLYANCFAILFLKQAAPPLPVLTGGR